MVVDHPAPLRRRQRRPPPRERIRAGRGLARAGIELGDEVRDRAGAAGRLVVPGAEDLQKDPLRPAVEGRVGGDHAATWIVAEPQPAELATIGLDVGRRRRARVLAGLDRVLLGRQAERVEAHRVQDVVAGHAQIAAQHVGADVAQRMPHVQPGPAGIREHVVQVILRAAGRESGAQRPGWIRRVERALALPALLPARLDLRGEAGRVAERRDALAGAVARHRSLLHRCRSGSGCERPLGRGRSRGWQDAPRRPGTPVSAAR
jgi:hypothetical protein